MTVLFLVEYKISKLSVLNLPFDTLFVHRIPVILEKPLKFPCIGSGALAQWEDYEEEQFANH